MKRLLNVSILILLVCSAALATEVRSLVTAPMQFEENQGQAAEPVRYLLRGGRVAGYFLDEGVQFHLGANARPSVVKMGLIGGRGNSRPEGIEPRPGRTNYFLGNEPGRWRTNIPSFTRVRYPEIYEGIDLVFYGRDRKLEYDFVLQPGASVDQVRMRFRGADKLEITPDGDLLVGAGAHQMTHGRPFVFQDSEEGRREVAARFRVSEDGLVGFEVEEYNRKAPLVIDPVIGFSTFLGGTSREEDTSLAVDAFGYVYIAGRTISRNFPVTAEAFSRTNSGPTHDDGGDLFVSKLSPDGETLLFSTFLGGRGVDESRSKGTIIAVDQTGRVFLTAATSSSDYPVTPDAYDTTYNGGGVVGNGDAVLSILSADGSTLEYSTYFGGTQSEEDPVIDLDSDGIPVIIGQTSSRDVPVTEDAFAAQPLGREELFIAKINPANAGEAGLEYATYFGGDRDDKDPGIVVLPDGAFAFVCETESSNFPTTDGAFDTTANGLADVTISVLDPSVAGAEALRYSTYFGGSDDDEFDGRGPSIAYGKEGDLYIFGETETTQLSQVPFPVTNNAFRRNHAEGGVIAAESDDSFLARLRPAGQGLADLIYSSYLGGRENDDDGSLAVSEDGFVFVAVETDSPDYPLVNPIQDQLGEEETDLAVTVFDPDGKVVFSTFIGGNLRDSDPVVVFHQPRPETGKTAQAGKRRADMEPVLYISAESESDDYPTTPGVFMPNQQGLEDAVVTTITELDFLPKPIVTPVATTLSAASFTAPVAPASIVSVFIEGASYPLAFPDPGPPPTVLGGLTAQIIDSSEAEFTPQLFFVGSNQVNLYVDDTAAEGEATVNIFEGEELVGTGTVEIRNVAPGIFFVGTEPRVAAAFSLTVNPEGTRVQVETFDGTLAPREIDLGPEGTGVYLLLFGTGVRNGANVTVTVGGESVPVLGALPHGTFIGLDQVNAGPLPASIAGRGLVDVVITVDGVASNPVKILIK